MVVFLSVWGVSDSGREPGDDECELREPGSWPTSHGATNKSLTLSELHFTCS